MGWSAVRRDVILRNPSRCQGVSSAVQSGAVLVLGGGVLLLLET